MSPKISPLPCPIFPSLNFYVSLHLHKRSDISNQFHPKPTALASWSPTSWLLCTSPDSMLSFTSNSLHKEFCIKKYVLKYSLSCYCSWKKGLWYWKGNSGTQPLCRSWFYTFNFIIKVSVSACRWTEPIVSVPLRESDHNHYENSNNENRKVKNWIYGHK